MRLMEILRESDNDGMNTYWEYEDGSGRVTINDVIRDLDNRKVPVMNMPMRKIQPLIINQDYSGSARERVSSADLSYPIILVRKNGKLLSILDGNHRAFKAAKSNAPSMKVRIIDLDDDETPEEYKDLFGYEIDPLIS